MNVQTELSYTNLRRLETIMMRVLNMSERMGLPPDVKQAVQYLEKMIAIIRTTITALHMLDIASGPLGWINALLTVSTSAYMATTFLPSANDVVVEVTS